MRSVVACPQRPWTAHTVKRRRAWHAITALGQHTRSNNIGRDLPSPPLDSIHGQTMLGVACQNRVWEAHTVEQRRAWHVIIAFGQHRRSDDVWRGMPSPPLDSTHGRMTSGVACHHRPWTTYTVGRRRAWHDIAVLGQHAWSDGVGQGMTSSPLGRTRSDYVGRGMTSSPLDSTHG